MMDASVRRQIEATAYAAGFDLVGIAAVPPAGSQAERLQRERFTAWAEQGHAGEMGWLLRTDPAGELLRSSLTHAAPWARSIVLCATNYNAKLPLSIEPAAPGTGWIARYAWSGSADDDGKLQATDYHDVLLRRLRVVEQSLHAVSPDTAIQTHSYVDTGPVVERWLAQIAGIGWIGKNTCMINQGMGSWLLLGVILTSLPLRDDALHLPAADRCGSCTRCIDACPTDALIAPRQMDAARCISYLTIEKKGSIAEELREAMGRQIFGCDICQDVCPWNRRAPIGTDTEMQPRTELVNPSLQTLSRLTPAEFKRQFKGSPLERTGIKRMRRNIAIAMGNDADADHRERLTEWSQGDDANLAEAALWALNKLQDTRL